MVKISRSLFVPLVIVTLLAVGGAPRLDAQTATATILGTVTDPSGAAVPEANAQAKNTETGLVQSVTSDAQGRYRIVDLPIGTYDIQVQKMGFELVVHKGVELSIGSQVVVDVRFPWGN